MTKTHLALGALGLAIAGIVVGLLLAPKAPADLNAGGVYSNVTNYFKDGITAGSSGQLTVNSAGNITLSGGTSASIYSSGFLVAGQGLVYSASGYGTTTAGSGFMPSSTLCLGQTWLDPNGSPAATLTLQGATTTFATCSGATAGAYSYQLIDNQAATPITFATTTGQANNSVSFYFATGTPAAAMTWPPKIQATTTALVMEMFPDSSHMNIYIWEFSKPPGW